MVGYAEVRKSTEYCHRGEYEVAEHWEDGCTVAVRYFKTKKLAERYMEDNYGKGDQVIMRKYRIYDIEWDDDGDDVELPAEVTMNISIADGMDVAEELGDWISDEYGYCHFGFRYEVIA